MSAAWMGTCMHCSNDNDVARAPRPRWRSMFATNFAKSLGAVLLSFFLFAPQSLAQPTQHDKAFWQSIAKNKYAVPEHESADSLAREISGLLSSPDPELRDDLAYSIFARWLYRPNILCTPTLFALTDEWR